MSEDTARRIAELEATLQIPGLPAAAREAVEAQLRALRESAAPGVNNSGTLYGNAAGVNLGTMQAFFGGKPGEAGEILLRDYLNALETSCQQLGLGRLRERRRSGADRTTTPPLRLQAVYTSLTTDGTDVIVHRRERPARRVQQLIKWQHKHSCAPDDVPPEQVRQMRFTTNRLPSSSPIHSGQQEAPKRLWSSRSTAFLPSDVDFTSIAPETPIRFVVTRPELALEAIQANLRLVLLGEPGHGKSTVLRYLALLLARRLRGEPVDIPGWPNDILPVPILCPLGSVAAALETHGGDADAALWQVLGDVLDGEQGISAGLRDFLKPALRGKGTLLLFDGLDELPVGAGRGGPRSQVAQAVQRLAGRVGARVVVTSRVLPYRSATDWQLTDEGWEERTIQPLAFGQVRRFVQGWYTALAASDPELSLERAEQRAKVLITELESNSRLRPLVQSPLLLTMLALLHYNSDGEIPRNRARLYHECVQLLLERWEPERTIGAHERVSRLQQLLARLPGLETDKLRDLIHELAFQAHDQPPDDDGRGRIDRYRLTGRLVEFFKRIGSADPSGHADVFLEVVREEAGLLIARDDESAYTFPHLTFQEYLAACWLADQDNMLELAYARWQSADRERWRQVLLLLAGRLRHKGQKDIERDGVPWLDLLSSPTARGVAKNGTQGGYDAVLAASSYAEMGGRAALATSMRDLVAQVERPLRTAIVDLLETPDPALQTADRIAAGRVLADLGDPRFPVEPEEWQQELLPSGFGGNGYWRALPNGMYTIGGWQERQKSAQLTLSSFWIARFPVTVAQFAPFVTIGYGPEAERWWTPEGWRWREQKQWNRPWMWDDRRSNLASQPVIGVTCYEAMAFCAWLNEQLADKLPKNYLVRLLSEAEWEVAASYAPNEPRRKYPWGEDEPTTERAIYAASSLDTPAPVGSCPAGAAACGAFDMAGNIWEWCASSYKQYPTQSTTVKTDFTLTNRVALRGGAYYVDSGSVGCGARVRLYPFDGFGDYGFRIVVAPRSH